MAPKSKKRASNADDYDADGGFVEDAPQSKRAKTAISKDKQVDEDDNPYWEVGPLNHSYYASGGFSSLQHASEHPGFSLITTGQHSRVLRKGWQVASGKEGRLLLTFSPLCIIY